ncbi:transglutaminase domain-containing protein [Dactylosporangium sp. NPDC000244]|uniref:transglutaminase domain-containing protein n=1 Tax=Dactylosporangium sp. NPDC000244 TaxID=3154365 RepID=UPI00331B24BB
MSRTQALAVYGVDSEFVDVLVDMGFPCEIRRDHVAFDPLDLENLGLDLRLPSASRAAMALWTRSFKDPTRLATARCTVQISWSCPVPGHAGGCDHDGDFTVSSQIEGRSVGPVVHDRTGWKTELDVRLLHDDHVFRNGFSALVQEAGKLHFHRLIPELAQDMEFLRRHRIADCRSANIYLAGVAAAADLVVRQASGYFVGSPFLVPHMWLEVDVDGRWVAADPFFLNTLARWGVVNAADWPPTRSPRNVLWRIRGDHEEEPLIKHGAVGVPVKLVARMSYEGR